MSVVGRRWDQAFCKQLPMSENTTRITSFLLSPLYHRAVRSMVLYEICGQWASVNDLELSLNCFLQEEEDAAASRTYILTLDGIPEWQNGKLNWLRLSLCRMFSTHVLLELLGKLWSLQKVLLLWLFQLNALQSVIAHALSHSDISERV